MLVGSRLRTGYCVCLLFCQKFYWQIYIRHMYISQMYMK